MELICESCCGKGSDGEKGVLDGFFLRAGVWCYPDPVEVGYYISPSTNSCRGPEYLF